MSSPLFNFLTGGVGRWVIPDEAAQETQAWGILVARRDPLHAPLGFSRCWVESPCSPRPPADTLVVRPAPHGDFTVVPSIRIEGTTVRLRWRSRGGLMISRVVS